MIELTMLRSLVTLARARGWNNRDLHWHLRASDLNRLPGEPGVCINLPEQLMGIPATTYPSSAAGEMQGYVAILENQRTGEWCILTPGYQVDVIPCWTPEGRDLL